MKQHENGVVIEAYVTEELANKLRYLVVELKKSEGQVIADALGTYYARLQAEDAGWYLGKVADGFWGPRVGGVWGKLRTLQFEVDED